jgi:hypothetical protein
MSENKPIHPDEEYFRKHQQEKLEQLEKREREKLEKLEKEKREKELALKTEKTLMEPIYKQSIVRIIDNPINSTTKNSEIPIEQLIQYWACPIFGIPFPENILYMKQHLQQINACAIIEKYFPYYEVKENYKTFYPQICLILTWLGILSNILSLKSICTLFVKGGKAIQHSLQSQRIKRGRKELDPYITNDIDVIIIPRFDTDSKTILKIGQNVSRFLQWACTYEGYPPILSVLQLNEEHPILNKSIIKISIKPERQGFLPLLDLGIGYYEFSPFIKWLYNEPTEKTYFFIPELNLEGVFMYQHLFSLIMEKLYYIIKYYSDSTSKTQDPFNIQFLRKSHETLNKLLIQASMKSMTKKENILNDYVSFIIDFMKKYEEFPIMNEFQTELYKDIIFRTINQKFLPSNSTEYYYTIPERKDPQKFEK